MGAVTMSRSRGLLTQLTTRPVVPATAEVSGSNTRTTQHTRGHRRSEGPAEPDRADPLLAAPHGTDSQLRNQTWARTCARDVARQTETGKTHKTPDQTSQRTPAEVNAMTGNCPGRHRRAL
jgi:hypothetical protein